MSGIPVAGGFHVGAAQSVDDRYVVGTGQTYSSLTAIPSGLRYEGLFAYQLSDSTMYQRVGGIADGDWTPLGTGGGGGGGNDEYARMFMLMGG